MDTLRQVSDVDLHGGMLSGLLEPYAAVPSMHFGHAALIGVVAFAAVRPWPMRAPALAYPVLVFVTIVGTANHYVFDAVAGAAVMARGAALVSAGEALRGRRRVEPQMSNCSLAR